MSVRKVVKEKYSKLASTERQDCECGKEYVSKIGYSSETMSGLPAEVLSVSAGCGNPTAIADLKKGQTVLDLGSGGGIDVFIAAREVGPAGKAIGVDATPEMIWRARKSAKTIGVENAEFRLGEIECMPVESGSIDVAISNCVINLSPDKDRVFKEVFRVLKPGGKLAVSDMVLTRDVSQDEREKLKTWASCIGGAIKLEDYLEKMKAAGFVGVKVESEHVYGFDELYYLLCSDSCGCGCGSDDVGQLAGMTGKSNVATVKIVAFKP
ncbi:arsenite methyltransferase [Methanooceanicella nereidis]|uniref:arsenite methyltransferase n=1 Tax=Methanooceanicella nereidis TaxID=2052831 RepID=UPI0034E297AF